MSCGDGTGGFLGFTVTLDGMCRSASDTGQKVSETQALVRAHNAARTVSGAFVTRSMGAWESSVQVFDSPSIEAGCGNLSRKRKGCVRSNPTWPAVIEYDGDFAIEALIGAEGTIRRTNPDGTYREAYGFIVGAVVIPNQASNEESLGRLDIQWEGGGEDDRGFVELYSSSGTELYPALP